MLVFALLPKTQNPRTPIESKKRDREKQIMFFENAKRCKNICTTCRVCGLYGGAGVLGLNDHSEK
jgi:hypothetical protein